MKPLSLTTVFLVTTVNDMETRKRQTQLVSVDWLELYCQSKTREFFTGLDIMEVGGLSLKLKGNGTRFFSYLYEVWQDKELLATLVAVPRASFLNPRMVLLKLENRQLYSQQWAALSCDLLKRLGLSYKGITRLDLCCDLKRFRNDWRPHAFIKKYMETKSDDFDYITRKGSNEFTCHGSKSHGGLSKLDYICWGSRTSQVRAYIYNKSKELREGAHSKPWIQDFWSRNGLMKDSKNDIWRCEISIRSQGMNILNFDTGELFKLKPEYLDSQRAVEKLFRIYAEKYFCFSMRNGKKKQRNFDRIDLFEYDTRPLSRPVSCKNFRDTGRTERTIANNIERRLEQTEGLTPMEFAAMKVTLIYYLNLSATKRMEYNMEEYRRYEKDIMASALLHADALKTLSFSPATQ